MKGIIFDFWGTLAENGTYSPMKQTFKMLRIRLPFPQFVIKFERIFMTKIFPSKAEAFKEVCRQFNVKCPDFVIENLVGLWNKNMLLAHLYEETEQVLKKLKEKGIKIALVSNNPEQNVKPVLEKFDLEKYFDVILLSFEEGLLKCDKAFYEKAVKKMGLNKEDVIVVGDSAQSDIRCATHAGLKSILIDRKDNREIENKILNLTQLLDVE